MNVPQDHKQLYFHPLTTALAKITDAGLRLNGMRLLESQHCVGSQRTTGSHHFHETVEQIRRIMRSGRGFGMILHAKQRLAEMPKTRNRAVIHVPMGNFAAQTFKAGRIDAKTVILTRDLHSAGDAVAHRLIGAAMAEFELERLCAKRQSQKLMAETDAEGWDFTGDFAQRHHGFFHGRRIAGTVGDKQPVGFHFANGRCGGCIRHHSHSASPLRQVAVDIPFTAAIQRDNSKNPVRFII